MPYSLSNSVMVRGKESAVWSAINHIANCNENSQLVSVMHCKHCRRHVDVMCHVMLFRDRLESFTASKTASQ